MQFKKALLALAVSAALPATAVAQYPAVTDPVTVTAKGFEALVAETPRSVNIITAEEIAFTDARTLGDLLIGQPGLSVATDGSVGLDPIIRGLKRDQIVVLIDGARVNAFQPGARGSLAAYVNVDLIERIEVIRGPSSVLYGSGAMGGVINIITRSGSFTDTPTVSGFTRLGYTSVDDGFRGALGTSYSDAQNVLDVSMAYLDTNDYKMGNGERLRDSGTEQNAIHLGYQRKIDERQQVRLRAQYDERRDVWFLASRTNRIAEIPPAAMGGRPAGITTHYAPSQTRTFLEGQYQIDLDDAADTRVQLRAYSQQLKRGNYDFSESLARNYFTSDPVFDNYGADIKVEMTPGDNHYLVMGLDWQLLDTSPGNCFWDAGFNPVNCFTLVENAKLEAIGVYIQDQIDFDPFIVDLGVRYDRVTGDADSAFRVAPPLKRTDNMFSWSTGVLWQASTEVNPYVNLSQGYRAGGLLERFLNFPGSDGFAWRADPQVKPERNITLEIGARGEVGNTSYSVAVYQSDIRDYIGKRAIGEDARVTTNLDEARIRGVEFSVDHRLSRDLSLYGVGTWLRGENRDAEYDEPLTQMPPSEFTVGISNQPSQGWNWRGQVRVVAKQDRVANIFSGGNERTSPSFTVVDAFAGYRFGQALGFKSSELMLSVTNLFDEDYREHVNEMIDIRLTGDPARNLSGVGVQDLNAPGRSLGLTWYAQF